MTRPTDLSSDPESSSGRLAFYTGMGLLAFVLVQAAYAMALNRLYYQYYGAFYDSMSYYARMVAVMDLSRTEGFFAGMAKAATNSTVFLPFGFMPFLAKWVEPTRFFATALQSVWVFGLGASLLVYFTWCRKVVLPLALALGLLFVSTHAIYFYNGGLSDFRMDLQLYLLFGITITWFLIALHQGRRWTWLVFGFAAGLCCLGRATSPVYIGLTCVPMALPVFFQGREKILTTLKGVALSAVICLVVAGWFFVLNWKHLHYYYFVWNLDANARLPLATSIRHFFFAWDSAGAAIIWSILGCGVIALSCWVAPLVLHPSAAGWKAGVLGWLRAIEWRAMAPALMPAGYLALSGAGLNPFVSMPSTFGIMLCVVSLAGRWPARGWRVSAIALVAFTGAGWSALSGVPSHSVAPGRTNRAEAYRAIDRAITHAVAGPTRGRVLVSQVSLGYYHNAALASYFTFDRPLPRTAEGFELAGKQLILLGQHLCAPPTEVEWKKFPGNSDEERIAYVVDTLTHNADFVILPTGKTADYLASHVPYNYINRFTPVIRARLLGDGAWIPLSDPIAVTDDEEYLVYRNSRLAPPSVAPP